MIKTVKAKIAHKCSICGQSIEKGEQYTFVRYAIIRGGSPERLPDDHECQRCKPLQGKPLIKIL